MSSTSRLPITFGVLVGGAATRMHGFPKGLLPHPSGTGTLVDHLVTLGRRVASSVVLVGRSDAYSELGVPTIPDAFLGAGPIGGLAALLRHASPGPAFLVGCDMPHLQDQVVLWLLEAMRDDHAAVLPSRGGKLEPLCAVYDPVRVLPVLERCVARSCYGLQALAREVGAHVVELPQEMHWTLDDWDAPGDLG